MKHLILFAIVVGFVSCNAKHCTTTNLAQAKVIDNSELIEIYKNDQADRHTDTLDWNIVMKNDGLREVRVYELLDSSKVNSSLDFFRAAMIFQHGKDSTAYGMAVKLMRKCIELDSTANKWLLAAAIDRDLLSRNKPQIYGTQYWMVKNQRWELRTIDITKITDAERVEYGVETLAQQREKAKQLNRKQLMELLREKKSVDEVIQLIKHEDIPNSNYDLSENGMNTFGYQLMSQGKKEEALKVFKLNTELYPSSYNSFDSYGECLLEMGDKENAIKAYKKSLMLNPANKNAKVVLSKIE